MMSKWIIQSSITYDGVGEFLACYHFKQVENSVKGGKFTWQLTDKENDRKTDEACVQ